LLVLIMLSTFIVRPAPCEPPPRDSGPDRAALRKNAEAFVAAFARGDSRALAAMWVPDGDYVDATGRDLRGRDAIASGFQEVFAEHPGLKLRIDMTSLRFVNPDVAIEDGTSAVIPPDGLPPSAARYTIVHVKQEGRWMLRSVREAPWVPPSHHEQLRELAWLIGDWSDAADQGKVAHVSFAWAEDRNFITARFVTTVQGVPVAGGTQWIGWDPAGKRVRSWTFDANGGFGEGSWRRDGDRWTIDTTAVLPDGKTVKASDVVVRVDGETLRWQSRGRTVDGKPQPDTAEITMKRHAGRGESR